MRVPSTSTPVTPTAASTVTALADAPVKFIRSELTQAFPRLNLAAADPRTVMALFDHLNIAERDHRTVLAALVAAVMAEEIPHPILALKAESGAAKTTTTRRIVSLVDPQPSLTRAAPRSEDAWLTTAAGSWCIGIDNLSTIPVWLSDAMCRAATGDADVRRTLYTNGDVSVTKFRRFLVINGIGFGSVRGDLAERLVAADLEPISEERRMDDETLNRRWNEAYPRLVANLLTFAALVHQKLPQIKLDRLPRMADFARIMAAVDEVCTDLGIIGRSALERFREQSDSMAEESLEDDDFIATVVELARCQQLEATVTSKEVLELAEDHQKAISGSHWTPDRFWPGNARQVTDRIHRNAPALRRCGIKISQGKTRTKTLGWSIHPIGEKAENDACDTCKTA